MSLLAFIILGAIIGWIASRIMGRDEGILMSIVIGVVGSIIGGYLARLISGGSDSYMTFSWANLFWSLIGSVILVAIINGVSGRRHHHNAA